MIVSVVDGSKSYGDKELFKRINLTIKKKDKIALIGANGVGKSTLFRVMMKDEYLDSGSVHTNGQIEFGFLKQVQTESMDLSVDEFIGQVFNKIESLEKRLRAVEVLMETDHSESVLSQYDRLQTEFISKGGYTYETEIKTMLFQFGFENLDMTRKLNSFSGGQITRLSFIKMLLSKPDVLFLDEPTNHLDLTTIEWLEGYLANYDGALVIISHDRLFLDRVCRSIIELEQGSLTRYETNYQGYIEQKAADLAKNEKLYRLQQQEIKKIEALIDKFRAQKNKAAFAKSKAKYLDRMDVIEKKTSSSQTFSAKFKSNIRGGKEVVILEDAIIGYDKPLASASFTFERGRRYAIVGANGIGKSTLLKTMASRLPLLGGEMLLGHQIQLGYFDQQLLEFQQNNTVIDEVWDAFPDLDRTQIRTVLGQFLFKGDDVFKEVSVLSGGERVRLALVKLMLEHDNVLIMDEPTNHLDIPAKEALESSLVTYDGTLIFVSHDRYFIDKLATDILYFEEGALIHTEKSVKEIISDTSIEKVKVKVDSKEAYQNLKTLRTKIRNIEALLDGLYEDLEVHREYRFNPEIYHDFEKMNDLNQTIDAIHNDIKTQEAMWIELTQEIEEAEISD